MKIATFGELMLQLTPPQSGDKISSSSKLKVDYVGAEANVAALGVGAVVSGVSVVAEAPEEAVPTFGVDALSRI